MTFLLCGPSKLLLTKSLHDQLFDELFVRLSGPSAGLSRLPFDSLPLKDNSSDVFSYPSLLDIFRCLAASFFVYAVFKVRCLTAPRTLI